MVPSDVDRATLVNLAHLCHRLIIKGPFVGSIYRILPCCFIRLTEQTLSLGYGFMLLLLHRLSSCLLQGSLRRGCLTRELGLWRCAGIRLGTGQLQSLTS